MKNGTLIWVCFRVKDDDAHINGIFLSENDAITNSMMDEGIAQVEMGARLPYDCIDAEKIYFPHRETWEQSPLYQKQKFADAIIGKFFSPKRN